MLAEFGNCAKLFVLKSDTSITNSRNVFENAKSGDISNFGRGQHAHMFFRKEEIQILNLMSQLRAHTKENGFMYN